MDSKAERIDQDVVDYVDQLIDLFELQPPKKILIIGVRDGLVIQRFRGLGYQATGIHPNANRMKNPKHIMNYVSTYFNHYHFVIVDYFFDNTMFRVKRAMLELIDKLRWTMVGIRVRTHEAIGMMYQEGGYILYEEGILDQSNNEFYRGYTKEELEQDMDRIAHGSINWVLDDPYALTAITTKN